MTKYEDKCLVSIRSVLESLLVLTSFDKGIGFRHIVMTLVCRISSIFFNNNNNNNNSLFPTS